MEGKPLPVWRLADYAAARRGAESALRSDNDALTISIQARGELFRVTISVIVGGKEVEIRSGLLSRSGITGRAGNAGIVPAVLEVAKGPPGPALRLEPLLKRLADNPDLRLDARITLKELRSSGLPSLSIVDEAGKAVPLIMKQPAEEKKRVYRLGS